VGQLVGPRPSANSALSKAYSINDFGSKEVARRTRRLVKIVGDQAAQPSGSYSQAAGGHRYQLKGYYRFLNNQREELAAHTLRGKRRARGK
jgi:hypothetical protein